MTRLTCAHRSLQMLAGTQRGNAAMSASSAAGNTGPVTVRLTLSGSAPALSIGTAQPVALTRLDAALLAVLALDGATSRQRLLRLFWPDQEPEDGRNALRQRLFRLRRAAGADLVRGSEQLTLADHVVHDLAPDGVHAGDLLAAFDYADCPELDDWLDSQRRALRQRRRAHDSQRIAQCERDARPAEGAALAERWIADDPLDETAVRWAMKLHYLAGERNLALAAFERFGAALAAEQPRARPAPETLELLATIRNAQAPPPALRRDIPASVLRPPRLVGREAELLALRAAWSGQRAFWLLGEAGLGKSRLIAEFIAQSFGEPGSAAALVVAARPGDGAVPYASLGRALRWLIERHPALLERTQRSELARVLPELDVVTNGRSAVGAQLVLQRAIAGLLHDAQRDGVAALVLDDLHFADSASLEMLQALACDDALAALGWGFAQRPAEGSPAIDALRAALEESRRVDALALRPLDEAQMRSLIDSLGLAALDAAQLAPSLTRHTGGNPMYALETIKHLIVSGPGNGARLPRPASVGQLIERRLRQLTPPALALARVAAVSGIDFGIDLAQAVLGTRALALTDAWHELEAAQVLRGNAFAHDLVHEATLAGVPAPIAAHTHGEVAAFLESHGGEPARVAAHWIAAGQAPRALAALHAAAAAAQRAMRRKEEAAFLERAATIESEIGDPAAFGSWRRMADAMWNADFRAIDVALLDRLERAATSTAQRADAQALRASWAQACGDLAEAKRLSRSVIELADAAGDEAIAADARQRLADLLQFDGDFETALALLQPLLPWAAERAGDHQRAVYYGTLAVVLDSCERGAEARAYHQRAIESSRKAQMWSDVVVVLGNLATSWAIAGHTQRSVEVLREAMQLAAAHDEARGCGAALPAEMFKSLRDSARYAEALRWVEPALANEPGNFLPLLKCHIACGWMHVGQHARAQRELDGALELQVTDLIRAKALQMRARLKMALNQRGAAALLDEALQTVRAHPGRRTLRASITLDHALTLAPAAALAAARGVIAEGERLELPGTALAGHVRAARFAVDAQDADAAVAHARAALAIGEDVAPNDLYPGERWLQAWRAFALAGAAADAAAVLQRGTSWVRTTAHDHVPDPFRDSFLRANAINQQLLRSATA